jgi:hypothetical protein
VAAPRVTARHADGGAVAVARADGRRQRGGHPPRAGRRGHGQGRRGGEAARRQGERAWWLFQLVAATPLETWGAPAGLAERAEPLVRQAWAVAAARQADEAWAVALLDAGEVEVDGEVEVEVPALLGAVAPERAVAVAVERVTRLGLTPAVLDLLDHCPGPWGPELSTAVVDRLATTVRRPTRPDAAAVALRGRVPDLGLRLDPAIAATATAALADATGWWSDVVSWLVDLLTFRNDMREELLT